MMRSLCVDVWTPSYSICNPQSSQFCCGCNHVQHTLRYAVGACLPAANCSLEGDTCCDGNQCAHEFLRCDKTSGSIFGTKQLDVQWIYHIPGIHEQSDILAHNQGVAAENICARCGGEAEQCCMDSNQVEYCAGSNMRCDGGVYPLLHPAAFTFSWRPTVVRSTSNNGLPSCTGVCVMAPGPCDQNQKGCCANIATGASYCATREDRLACDIAAAQDGESSLKCEYCGAANQPCCFPSSMDARTASSWEIASVPSPCTSADATEPLACVFDKGSADYFNRCEIWHHGDNESCDPPLHYPQC
jgi:hypothetical protein